MDGLRLLSGSELVAKGVTKKVEGKFSGLGCKEVSPSGSWLQQKQIQSALEARKHLIEVDRIEKSGSISHALWRDDLQLAEVVQETGGHWRYIGHNVGKLKYLLPEETLFLMETNCLLLKHNEVTVSLQKAYSLCLGEVSIVKYKVYASLSRLGYRMFRHKEPKVSSDDKSNIQIESKDDQTITDDDRGKHPVESKEQQPHCSFEIDSTLPVNESNGKGDENPCIIDHKSNVPYMENGVIGYNIVDIDTTVKEETNVSTSNEDVSNNVVEDCIITDSVNSDTIGSNLRATMNIDDNANETIDRNMVDNENIGMNNTIAIVSETMDTSRCNTTSVVYSIDELGVVRIFGADISREPDSAGCRSGNSAKTNTKDSDADLSGANKSFERETNYYHAKMQKLVERKSNTKSNRVGLNTLQDFNEEVVIVNVPDEKYLPRNIFLHKTAYAINIDVVRNQNASNVNISSDEMDPIILPQTSNSTNIRNQVPAQNAPNQHFDGNSYRPYRPYYRPSPPWRPQQNFNTYYTYNMYRPPQMNFANPRYRFQPHPFVRQHFINFDQLVRNSSNNLQNNRNTMKMFHYNTIQSIAMRFKRSMCTTSQVRALHRLLSTYNSHYDEHLELTTDFDILDRKEQDRIRKREVREVIVLDDEPKSKKARVDNDNENMKQNLEKLKALAAKLKELQMKDLAVSRHRRVFSNAIKTFNKYFKADVYLDCNFEIKDRKLIVIDSSSDSDAVVTVVEDTPVNDKGKSKKRKKLRNPYNILKRFSRNDKNEASTSREVPTLQMLSLNANVAFANQNGICENDTASPVPDNTGEGLLKYFNKAWLPNDDNFGKAELISRVQARFDKLLFEQEYINDVLKESAQFENWLDLKMSILRDVLRTLEIQKEQAEALSNDFFMETKSQIQPLVKSDCADLRSALKQLAIIPRNKNVPAETRFGIDFDVYDRDVNIKKTNLPKPNFRVICLDESAQFPSSEDVVALQAKYTDGVPTVFAFIGDSISYLHVNWIDLPVFIPDDLP